MDARDDKNCDTVRRRIQPLGKNIAIMFLEPTSGGQFINKTDWGFNYQVSTMGTKQRGRWARVLAVGELVQEHDVHVDQFVFLEPLMWTVAQEVENMQFWLTSLDKVWLTSEVEPAL